MMGLSLRESLRLVVNAFRAIKYNNSFNAICTNMTLFSSMDRGYPNIHESDVFSLLEITNSGQSSLLSNLRGKIHAKSRRDEGNLFITSGLLIGLNRRLHHPYNLLETTT